MISYYGDLIRGSLGNDRVRFVKGYIQDLALDVEAMEKRLSEQPVVNAQVLSEFELWKAQQRHTSPVIPDNSIDLVISNCVLNLVSDDQKRQMIQEIYRVVKPGRRIAISDIISDEPIPQHLKDDKELWSGCISGAFQEQEMLEEFLGTGFQAVSFHQWAGEPWQVIEGIEFRSITITGVKGEGNECLDEGHAVIYRGPHSFIKDDDGYEFPRGERMAVCERTFRFLTEGPYQEDFIGIRPSTDRKPVPWCAPAGTKRPASETKGGEHVNGSAEGSCC